MFIFRVLHVYRTRIRWYLIFFLFLALTACQPTIANEPIIVTEVVMLGDIEIIVTRVIEAVDTPTPTPPPPVIQERAVELDLAYLGSLPDLDPQHAASESSLDLSENLFVGLTNYNIDLDQVEPELATAWDVSGNGRIWTFQLRDDIFWIKPDSPPVKPNDPWSVETVRPVVAADVVFAIERACTAESATSNSFLLFIIEGCETLFLSEEPTEDVINNLGIKALDDQTIEVTLTQPASYFLTLTTLPFFRPLPVELVEEFGDQWKNPINEFDDGWQTPDNIITNGPFFPSPTIFSDEEIVLHENPLWPLPRQGNVDNINILYFDDEMEMYELWSDKLLDISSLPVEVRDDFLQKTPNKAKLVTNQTIFYLGINFESGVFQDPAVRRAFNAAIDRESLVTEMFDNRAQELRHFSPPGVFGAPPVNEVGKGYNPDYARQQMNASSFRNCKLLPPITFLVSTADLSLLQAELIRDMWGDELDCDDLNIQIEQVSFGELLASTAPDASERPDLWELAWPTYSPDAHNVLFEVFHCNEGENRQNRPCSDEDDLLRQASVTPNIDDRRGLYREVENLFFGEDGAFPAIPLYVRGNYSIVQSWLTFKPALSGGKQFDTYKIDEELKRLERSRG